jgi:hypothetical protein
MVPHSGRAVPGLAPDKLAEEAAPVGRLAEPVGAYMTPLFQVGSGRMEGQVGVVRLVWAEVLRRSR